MAKTDAGQLVKTQQSFTTQIKIGENTVNLPCILDFNEAKGTGVVNIKILTKHLSPDPKQRELFLMALQRVGTQAYDGFLEKVIEFEKGKSGVAPNQQDLFSKDDTGTYDDEGALVNVGEDDYEDEED
jgi:hypothetical protein